MSDGGGGDCGGFGGDFGGHDGGCHHSHDAGSHHYYDGGAGYYYDAGNGAEGAMGASGGVAQKKVTLMERIGAMSGWQKVSAVAGVAAVLDGVRRIFAHSSSSLKEDASPEEKKNAVNQQLLGAVEGVGGGLWTAKILEDAGKAAIRRL